MRRGLAGLIVGFSLVLASVAWAAFVLTHTALDPGRSERLADQTLENETLRRALVSRLASSMEDALPIAVPLPRSAFEAAAETTLDNPQVEALVRDGLVQAYENALEGNGEPVELDASALGQAGREALVAERPELDLVLPAVPPMPIEIPTTGLNWLGTVRRIALRVTWILGVASAAGALFALPITKDRPAVLRRVSKWAFGAAAFWLVVGYAIPYLTRTVAPTSAAVAAALIDVFFGAMIRPAIFMAVFGAALLALSVLWASINSKQGARLVAAGQSTPRRTQQPAHPRRGVGGRASSVRPATGPAPATQPGARPPAPEQLQRSGPLPTTDQIPAVPFADPTATTGPASTTERPRRWIEGVGYVDDPAGDANG